MTLFVRDLLAKHQLEINSVCGFGASRALWSASVLALIKNRNKDQVTRSTPRTGKVSHPVIPHTGEPFLLRSCGDMN
jgi:hypothetical protein